MTPTEFLTQYYPFAKAAQDKYGVPAEVILAQAALESGWGKSKLTTEANNFFGVKADPAWTGEKYLIKTREVKDGKDYYVDAYFRKYPTAEGSFQDHAKFLTTNARYKPAFAVKSDPKAFAAAIAKAGYATDPKYTELLHKLIDGSKATLSKFSKDVVVAVKANPGKSSAGLLLLAALAWYFLSKKK